MAGNSSLTVSIGADVADLQAKTALAQNVLNKLNGELRNVANQLRTASEAGKAALLPTFQALAAQTAAARVEAGRYSAELDKTVKSLRQNNEEHQKSTGVIAQNRVAFAELEHSARAVADGFAAGIDPLRLFGMEALRVVQAVTEFNTISGAALGVFGTIGAAAVAAAGGLAYLVREYERMKTAKDAAAMGEAIGVHLSPQQRMADAEATGGFGDTHKSTEGVSYDQRAQVESGLANLRTVTPDLVSPLMRALPDIADALGQKLPEAGKTLEGALTDLGGNGAKLMDQLTARMKDGESQMKAFHDALANNDAVKAQTILLTDLTNAAKNYVSNAAAAPNTTRDWMAAVWNNVAHLGQNGPMSPADIDAQRAAAATENMNRLQDAITSASRKGSNKSFGADMELVNEELTKIRQNTALSTAQQESAIVKYLDGVKAKLGGSFKDQEELNRAYNDAVANANRSASAEELKTITRTAEERAAAAGGGMAHEREVRLAYLRSRVNDAKLTADDRIALNDQIASISMRVVGQEASASKKAMTEAYEVFVQGMEEKIEAAKGDALQQIEIVNQWIAHARQVYGQDSKEYIEAIKKKIAIDEAWAESIKKNEGHMAEARKTYQEGVAIGQTIGAKPDVNEFKPNIGLVFDSSGLRAKVDAQITQLREAMTTQIAALQQDMATQLAKGTGEGAQVAATDFKQIEQAMKSFAVQSRELNDRAAQAATGAWQKITAPIGSAFDSIVDGAMTSHAQIGAVVDKALIGVAESYIKMGVKAVENWAATEMQKTFLTTSGEAARQAAQTPAQVQQMAQLAALLAKVVATEAGKTAAVTSGVAAQTSAQAAGHAAQAAQNEISVQGDAAVAAAGAMAATAAIPIVGPELAPGVAASTYATTEGFGSLASAAGGWDRVPTDGAPAILHKNEMVLPATLASGIRDMIGSGVRTPTPAQARLGGTSSTVNNSGDTTHAMTINHTQHIDASGNTGNLSRSVRDANAHLYGKMQEWYGKSVGKLPGR